MEGKKGSPLERW